MADKKRKKSTPDNESKSQRQPIMPLLIMTVAALLVVGVAAVFLHAPTRNKAKRFIDNNITAAGDQATGTDGAPANIGDAAMKFQKALDAKFAELELRDTADYSIKHFPRDNAISIEAVVPKGRPMEWVIWNLSSLVTEPYRVEDCVCASETNCTITIKSEKNKHPKITLKVLMSKNRYMSSAAKMAVLIENFIYEANTSAMEYLSFPEPLTVAILPADKLAARTAQIADEHKKEIVLLLPMEPLPPQYDKYKESMVIINHTDDDIRRIITHAAAAIPNFAGVCNFYGAKVMEDSKSLKIVLSEVSKRKAYFVYTDASKKSVAPQLTKSMKIPNASIQGAIDAAMTEDQARKNLRHYSIVAEKTGKALIKAQPSPVFIKVLKEETDALKKNGIRLVYVSELLK